MSVSNLIKDLAVLGIGAEVGADKVVYQATGEGAVPRTVQDELRERVSVTQFGAKGDGVTDDTAAIQAALFAGAGKLVVLPDMTYRLTETLVVMPFTTVDARQARFISEAQSNAVTFYTPTADRVPATLHALTVAATEGAATVTVLAANAAHYAPGDMVLVRDPALVNNGQTYGREINVVDSVDAATGVITLCHPLNWSYATTGAIAKITPAEGVTWIGGDFDMAAVNDIGVGDKDTFYIYWARNCHVRDVTVRNNPYKSLEFFGSLHCSAENFHTLDSSYTGPGMGGGPKAVYSRFILFRGMYGRRIGHGCDVSGGSDTIIDGVFTSGRTDEYTHGIQLHGLGSKRTVISNVVTNNCNTGFVSGNPTFSVGDFDFVVSGLTGSGCDTDVYITSNSENFRIDNGVFTDTVLRSVIVQNSKRGTLQGIRSTGVTTNPANYGAIDINTSEQITLKDCEVVSAAPTQFAFRAAGTINGLLLENCSFDHSGNSAVLSILNPGSTRIIGGRVINRVATDCVSFNSTGAFHCEGLEVDGKGVGIAGIKVQGGSSSVAIKGGRVSGVSEGVRVENTGAIVPVIVDQVMSGVGTGIRLVGTMTAAVAQGNQIAATSNKVVNSAGAKLLGTPCIQGGVSADRGDTSVTLIVGEDEETQRFATALTVNRTVTLNTGSSRVFPGATFTIVRTGLGAFTLNVGGLKTIPADTAATVTVVWDGAAWRLKSYNLLA